ncbi:MAG: tetratricopeptide repeat protein [Deltaproteobacteria bacterium]|nr:tetratricopeptide repeat protein [Deltaproteobacteria bacterium]
MEEKHSQFKNSAVIWVGGVFLVIGFFIGIVVGVYKSDLTPTGRSMSGNAGKTPELKSRIAELKNLVRQNPDDPESWIVLGNACFDANQYEESIQAYQKALAINPGNADVWTDMGVMYRLSDQPREAIRAFDKAAEIDPMHEISRINKGIVLLHDLKDSQGAIRAWEAVLVINPLATLSSGQSVDEMLNALKKQGQSLGN